MPSTPRGAASPRELRYGVLLAGPFALTARCVMSAITVIAQPITALKAGRWLRLARQSRTDLADGQGWRSATAKMAISIM